MPTPCISPQIAGNNTLGPGRDADTLVRYNVVTTCLNYVNHLFTLFCNVATVKIFAATRLKTCPRWCAVPPSPRLFQVAVMLCKWLALATYRRRTVTQSSRRQFLAAATQLKCVAASTLRILTIVSVFATRPFRAAINVSLFVMKAPSVLRVLPLARPYAPTHVVHGIAASSASHAQSGANRVASTSESVLFHALYLAIFYLALFDATNS